MLASHGAYTLIKHFEGLRLKSYKDVNGLWAIGYGHCSCRIGPKTVITRAQADRILAKDVAILESMLNRMLLREIEQHQFDALISFAYNAGIYALKYSTLLKFVNLGGTKSAADEFLKWNRGSLPNGKKISIGGLTRRRAIERQYFLTGKVDF